MVPVFAYLRKRDRARRGPGRWIRGPFRYCDAGGRRGGGEPLLRADTQHRNASWFDERLCVPSQDSAPSGSSLFPLRGELEVIRPAYGCENLRLEFQLLKVTLKAGAQRLTTRP